MAIHVDVQPQSRNRKLRAHLCLHFLISVQTPRALLSCTSGPTSGAVLGTTQTASVHNSCATTSQVRSCEQMESCQHAPRIRSNSCTDNQGFFIASVVKELNGVSDLLSS
jgi:hypothetical protein